MIPKQRFVFRSNYAEPKPKVLLHSEHYSAHARLMQETNSEHENSDRQSDWLPGWLIQLPAPPRGLYVQKQANAMIQAYCSPSTLTRASEAYHYCPNSGHHRASQLWDSLLQPMTHPSLHICSPLSEGSMRACACGTVGGWDDCARHELDPCGSLATCPPSYCHHPRRLPDR
jgi:hypothetical protein